MRFATALNAAGAKKIPDQRSGSLKPAIDVPITRPTPSIGLVCGLMQAPDLVSAAICIGELVMHLTKHCKQEMHCHHMWRLSLRTAAWESDRSHHVGRGIQCHGSSPLACIEDPMYEIVSVLILPVMLIVYYAIQRLVVHHSNMEVKLMIHDLVVEAMNKHDHDFDD